MKKGLKRYCTFCTGELEMRLGLLYKTYYCSNCGAFIRARRTITGKEIYLNYESANCDTIVRIEMRRGKKNDRHAMSDL